MTFAGIFGLFCAPLLLYAQASATQRVIDQYLLPYAAPYMIQPSFETVFTHPQCARYDYKVPIKTLSGQYRTSKPLGAYCTNDDANLVARYPDSLERRLINWIKNPALHTLFISTLSFKNIFLEKELCEAIGRGVKLTLLLDSAEGKIDNDLAHKLNSCATTPQAVKPVIGILGHRAGIRYFHIKLWIFGDDSDFTRIIFGSGNLSIGTRLNHENWQFITAPKNSYFARFQQCVAGAETNHSGSAAEFTSAVSQCRQLLAGQENSSDSIQSYFIPGETKQLYAALDNAFAQSASFDLAAHKFSSNFLRSHIEEALKQPIPHPVRAVFDDDMYYAGHDESHHYYFNSKKESALVEDLSRLGMQTRYVETNRAFQLQHNKFIIFRDAAGKAQLVLTGAANFTEDGFNHNMENFYLIRDPKVVQHYDWEFHYLWNMIGTRAEDLPVSDLDENAFKRIKP